MYPTLSIPKLHNEYRSWINELNFSKGEIRIFEHHLEHLVKNHTSNKVTAQIEHFQNQFIRHKEVIDILKHKLHVSEKQLAAFVLDVSGMGLENIKMDNHPNLRQEMITFRKIYSDLKKDFRKFESEWF